MHRIDSPLFRLTVWMLKAVYQTQFIFMCTGDERAFTEQRCFLFVNANTLFNSRFVSAGNLYVIKDVDVHGGGDWYTTPCD